MQQYFGIKSKHPDAVLLFRVGDFYETFGEDAIRVSKVLGIVLTHRNNGSSKLELAGFPHHSIDNYLPKLVRAGMRVAVCDQLEDPKMTKTIVKRGVTELVTPGVVLNDQVLEYKKNNYLASIYLEKEEAGISFLDISTGEFFMAEGSVDYMEKLLQTFSPNEVLFPKQIAHPWLSQVKSQRNYFGLEDWVYTLQHANSILLKHFEVHSLKGFGIESQKMGLLAAGAILQYLSDTQHLQCKHITKISLLQAQDYLWMDSFTLRNLELLHSPHANAKTLLDIIDQTRTPMGGRLLKRWLAMPLKEIEKIRARHQAVECLCENEDRDLWAEKLSEIIDLERITSKISVGKINPRELVGLHKSLICLSPIKDWCLKAEDPMIQHLGNQMDDCKDLSLYIQENIAEDAPVLVQKGGVIKKGVSLELDELRGLAYSGKDYLVQLQQREMEKTGISSLKVGFTNVFGYYLEVTNTHKDKVPVSWHRKQTLTNAERYVTEELKEYEEKILGAEDKILNLEQVLYQQILQHLFSYIQALQKNAYLIAQLDILLCFATISKQYKYVKPDLTEENILDIHQGRHPVIEKSLQNITDFIPNSIYLDADSQQIMMITGPNMAGKSALLRQTALISILAQMGCFVPAQKAKLGIIDRIYTRVGASDNISSGESTFMVEMTEAATILNNITPRSLVLLDEIGRGTSTYDGVSIAWAMAEYLHEHEMRPKTMFATHYHELNNMTHEFKRIKNYHVSVKEMDHKILFLRKLVEGGTEHSFGIHVAKMAGVPLKVTQRAAEVLKQLEQSRDQHTGSTPSYTPTNDNLQLSFFQLDDPVIAEIRQKLEQLNINELTPIEALVSLNEIKKLVKS